ncbi:methyltransferase domain-containing protein [Patescibacteria group bacterium]
MNVVLGNKKIEIDKKELNELTKCYEGVIIDLGTGDGRFVFKNALKEKDFFFMGIDPSEKQLLEYSKKAVRKKLPNLMYVVGSVEQLPIELENVAQKIYINLPWGSLLSSVVNPNKEIVKNIGNLLKKSGSLEITVGYHEQSEPSETERLNLPDLNEDYINSGLAPVYKECGFELSNLEKIEKKDLKKIETTWSKKLSFGKDRDVFKLVFNKS